MVTLSAQVHKYIDQRVETIRKNAESAYEILVDEMARGVDKQLAEKRKEGEAVRKEMTALSEDMNMVRMYLENLQAEGEMQ
ncbi:MAG: hypothetical protein IKH16_08980 [Selenomonadaceae bacterium]|nr:hypothetical protein [Selenomonadaceae bacterium]